MIWRAGQAVVLASRNVTIHSLDLVDGGADWEPCAPMSRAPISAASRATSRWRWERAGMSPCCGGKAGPFTLDQAISLDKLNEWGQGAPLEQ
jgi:tRNA pseudouridine55 synthase